MTEDISFFQTKKEIFLKDYEPFSLLSNNLLKKDCFKATGSTLWGPVKLYAKRGQKGNCLFIIHTGSVVENFN